MFSDDSGVFGVITLLQKKAAINLLKNAAVTAVLVTHCLAF
jgi:hypothetical protein